MNANLPPLLRGPYFAPPLRIGDRTYCLVRGCPVVVTSWTDAPISWPRCHSLDKRGGTGLLVNTELARAIECESAAAIIAHWDVTDGVVWRWRKALEVTCTNNEGSRRARCAAARKGGAVNKVREYTAEEREQRRQQTQRLGLARHLQPGYHGPLWTAEELALLGTASDEEVAARIGKTVTAVRVRRRRAGIDKVTG